MIGFTGLTAVCRVSDVAGRPRRTETAMGVFDKAKQQAQQWTGKAKEAAGERIK